MQAAGYKAAGWLGVVTAGLLWVPLVELDAGIDQLVQQIRLAMPAEDELLSDAEGGGAVLHLGGAQGQGIGDTALFSVEEMRQELDRLRADLTAAHMKVSHPPAGGSGSKGPCALPPGVPELPAGLRVSAEMEKLALALLAPNSKGTRCSFVGMGGEITTVMSASTEFCCCVRVSHPAVPETMSMCGTTQVLARRQSARSSSGEPMSAIVLMRSCGAHWGKTRA